MQKIKIKKFKSTRRARRITRYRANTVTFGDKSQEYASPLSPPSSSLLLSPLPSFTYKIHRWSALGRLPDMTTQMRLQAKVTLPLTSPPPFPSLLSLPSPSPLPFPSPPSPFPLSLPPPLSSHFFVM